MTTSAAHLTARGSGRTTRHLERAIGLAKKGGKVIYVAANEREKDRLTALARQLAGRADWVLDGGNLRVVSADSQALVEDQPGNFRWLGAWPDAVLVDHFTLEDRYPGVIDQWRRAVK